MKRPIAILYEHTEWFKPLFAALDERGADYGRGLPIEAYDPPAEIVDEARRLVAAAGMDVGGAEYLVDARDGGHSFYDVNALSNFVADAPNVIGFNPYVNLADLIIERARGTTPAASAA